MRVFIRLIVGIVLLVVVGAGVWDWKRGDASYLRSKFSEENQKSIDGVLDTVNEAGKASEKFVRDHEDEINSAGSDVLEGAEMVASLPKLLAEEEKVNEAIARAEQEAKRVVSRAGHAAMENEDVQSAVDRLMDEYRKKAEVLIKEKAAAVASGDEEQAQDAAEKGKALLEQAGDWKRFITKERLRALAEIIE